MPRMPQKACTIWSEGQVVIDGEEDPRLAIDTVGEVPPDLEVFRHRIAQRHSQARDQPADRVAPAPGAQARHRAGDEETAAHHQQGDHHAGGLREPLRPAMEGVGKVRACDEIHDEQHQELDELAADPDPDPLVAGHPAGGRVRRPMGWANSSYWRSRCSTPDSIP